MKKVIASLILVSMAVAVQAQEEKHPGHRKTRHHHRTDLQQLNLTAEQKTKLKAQQDVFRKQLEDLKKNETITVKEWKTRMESIRKEHRSGIQNLLTADQKSQLEKMRAERAKRYQEGSRERMEKMKTRLGLSEEQSARLEKSRTDMGNRMKELRENKSLSDEQKKEQMKELMKQRKKQLKSILTEEQLQKLKERKPHDHHKKEII
jgi:hypothetical protein